MNINARLTDLINNAILDSTLLRAAYSQLPEGHAERDVIHLALHSNAKYVADLRELQHRVNNGEI